MKPITEQERQDLIAYARIEISRWVNISDKRYMSDLMEIALASLTAEPVGVIEKEIGSFYKRHYDKSRTEAVYTYPPVPVIKLPDEMMKQATGWFVNSSGENCATIEGRTWNKCIAEFKRLNGIK